MRFNIGIKLRFHVGVVLIPFTGVLAKFGSSLRGKFGFFEERRLGPALAGLRRGEPGYHGSVE